MFGLFGRNYIDICQQCHSIVTSNIIMILEPFFEKVQQGIFQNFGILKKWCNSQN